VLTDLFLSLRGTKQSHIDKLALYSMRLPRYTRNDRFFSAVILSLCILFVLSTPYTSAQDLVKKAQPVFQAGEQLNYRMKYGLFTAAETHLRVEESANSSSGHPAYHIIADGQTAGTFDVFYKVRNRYETWIDKNTLLPYQYTENRHEGSWKHTDKVTFDRAASKVTNKNGTYPLRDDVFDFPSAYYFARTLDISKMRIGEKFDLRYFLDGETHALTITYLGKEKISCPMGTFSCLKFNPTIIPGRIFKEKSKLYLWITDDENRIPVKAHVEVMVGSLTMELTSAKGLKYPLNPLHK
jgi:hypothetical protein